MRKQTIKVVQAFLRGQVCNGATCKTKRANRDGLVGDGERIIHTDGRVLYSYRMPIAAHAGAGNVVHVIPYAEAPSATTREHVRTLTQHMRYLNEDSAAVRRVAGED